MEHGDVFYVNSFLENAGSDLLADVMTKNESCLKIGHGKDCGLQSLPRFKSWLHPTLSGITRLLAHPSKALALTPARYQ